MRDIRKAIGPKKLLTLATVASGEYIDFQAILPYIDFVNIMSYDMGNALSTILLSTLRTTVAG